MRYAKGWFADLPDDDYGKGHIPNPEISAGRLKNFVFDHASLFGLAIGLIGLAIA